MLNAILSLFRMILLILGGYEQVALENLALREQLAIFHPKRSASQDSTNGPTILGGELLIGLDSGCLYEIVNKL